MSNTNPQWKRISEAMLNGEVVSRLWAAKQVPIISQPTNRCNELIRKGIPVQKVMIYPENGEHYMSFFFKQEYIDHIKTILS